MWTKVTDIDNISIIHFKLPYRYQTRIAKGKIVKSEKQIDVLRSNGHIDEDISMQVKEDNTFELNNSDNHKSPFRNQGANVLNSFIRNLTH